MFLHAIVFDAAMPVAHVLGRLARYGIWEDPQQPDARDWIASQADLLELPFDRVAAALAEPRRGRFGAAIRRQWVQNVLWYARPLGVILDACLQANRDATLGDVLNLHEYESQPPLTFQKGGGYDRDGVVMKDGHPAGISVQALALNRYVERGLGSGSSRSMTQFQRAEPPPASVTAWPDIKSPGYVAAKAPFDVTIGFAAQQQRGVTGSQVVLPAPPGVAVIDVTVDLIVDGVEPPANGWSLPMRVPVNDPTSARVTFTLVGREPAGPQPVHLTTIEVRYVVAGAVCGTASAPLVIGPSASPTVNTPEDKGTAWLAQAPTAAGGEFGIDPHAPDLTVELIKPNKNQTEGSYVCKLYSKHQLATAAGPFDVQLGQDAKTFAHSVIAGVRQYSGNVLVTKYLRAVGGLVTEKLPPEVFDALTEVAGKVAPRIPAVLFVSDEPFVPWELALLRNPIDPAQPPFLSAQADIGRWFRDSRATAGPMGGGADGPQKPPPQPPSSIPVAHLAAMAGNYKPASGLQALPHALQEVAELKTRFGAIALAATPQSMLAVLDAKLEDGTVEIGPAGGFHFAGHGQFNPGEPDSSVLYLNDGTALSSLLFRDANYGGPHQPIIFFNACMIGVGGEVLGDLGGFPGNCLRGGFGAVLGALWEIDDGVAGAVATEFWDRVLPAPPAVPEPVPAVLRDLRTRYASKSGPIPTYMAYTYWGHPRLTLERRS